MRILSVYRPEAPGYADPARTVAVADYGLPGVADVARDADQVGGEGRLEDSLASLRRLAYLAAQVCETSSAVINIIDATHQHTIAAFGVDPTVCSVSDSMCALVFDDASPVMVADTTQDDRFRGNPFVTGELGFVRLYASAPLVNPGGHVLGRLCVLDSVPGRLSDRQLVNLETVAGQVVEVLELRRRTLRLANTHTELTRSNELLSEFAGRLSHDLKNPLSSVLGFGRTLNRLPTVRDDPDASRLVGNITAAGERMHELIDEMLELASVGGRPHFVPVELAAVMKDLEDDLDGLITDAQARIEIDSAQLVADRRQLHIMLQNLVTNAITYRSPERPCYVQVRAVSEPRGWTLQVIDNGMGVPDGHKQDVLRPLYRLGRDSSVGGTGLGLATCVRVAEEHNGHLAISDTPGGGTTVTVQAEPLAGVATAL
jgi:signal transduction histidine kinase